MPRLVSVEVFEIFKSFYADEAKQFATEQNFLK